MNPIIELKDVRKSFGTHQVLKGVGFDVHPGEVICLLGPSGGGKSTVLRTINALETIDSGVVRVCGEEYGKAKPEYEIRRHTAMIFQRFELFPHLTAMQNVALAPRTVLSKPPAEAERLAKDLLARVGLADHGHKYPNSLSGGQQQRVAIARALALGPKVLLCDEPTSALDPELVQEVRDLLEQIAREGMTMIVVTHEISFARSVAHRCLFLDCGEVAEQGSSKEFFENPRSARLKQFLEKVRH